MRLKVNQAELNEYVRATWGDGSPQVAFVDVLLKAVTKTTRFIPPAYLRSLLSPLPPALVDEIALAFSMGTPRLLELRFYFASEDSSGAEFEIEVDELEAARLDGYLVHPESGREFPDFERCLYPFFRPSPDLVQALV